MTLIIKENQVTIDAVADRDTDILGALRYFPEYECRYVVWDVELPVEDGYSSRPVSKVLLQFS